MRENYSRSRRIAAVQNINERDYWLNKLSGRLEKSSFLCDGKKESAGAKEGAFHVETFGFEDRLFSQLIKITKGSDIKLHVVVTAVLTVLLARYSGKKDIIVGIPIYKQAHPQGDDAAFVNTVLAIRNRLDLRMTFKELLLQVGQSVYEANENQNYPLETLMYKLNMPVSQNDFPLFDAAVLLENIHDRNYLEPVNPSAIFNFFKTPGGVHCTLEYKARLYEKSFIERIIAHFSNILREGIFNLDLRLWDIDMLAPGERKLLLHEFNDNRAEFPRDKTVHHFVRENAAKTPGTVAVVSRGAEITYGNLNQRTDSLAGRLRAIGIRGDHPAAILLPRSPRMAESILAVWKAGGAYIPIDPGYPLQRILEILKDSRAAVLITESTRVDSRLKSAFNGKIITGEEQERDRNVPIESRYAGGALAYIIYTSGSTGKPKGVMVEHAGMMNHMQAKICDLQLDAKSIVAQNASHTFDISVWQFFTAFITGGKTAIYSYELVLDARRLLAWLTMHRVTVLEVVPSYLSLMLEVLSPGFPDLGSLRSLIVTGETVSPNLVKQWFARYPNIKMINAYGPTEASDDITHWIMEGVPLLERVPIGKPLQNLAIVIMDEDMNLCPVGVKGEIYVSGIGVGRGYLNNPEVTAEKFLTVKAGRRKKLYRTGDLGRWLPGGVVDFFGRKDFQVKIRGYRIELGEIEQVLTNFPGIKGAVVIERNKQLCAYLVSETGADKPAVSKIKEHLAQRLPGYMVPEHIVHLARMPLSSNGKVDRKALPPPQSQFRPPSAIPYIAAEMLTTMTGRDISAAKLPGHPGAGSREEMAIIEDYSRREGKKYYPLSHSQKMVYYVEKTYPGTACENDGDIVKYRDTAETDADRAMLEEAINCALYRNENLRTRIVEIEHEGFVGPAQYIYDYKYRPLEYFDFSTPGKAGEKNLETWVNENNDEPFDFIGGDLFYFALVKFSEEESGYYMKLHHIISDGNSTALLIHEIDSIYRDLKRGNVPTHRLNPSHTRFMWDEREYLSSSRAAADREFWLKYLLPLPGEIVISSKGGDPSKTAGGSCKLIFPGQLRTKMHDYCREGKTSLYKILLSALAIYTAKVTGLDEFIIGTLNHGRSKEIYKEMMGMFINFIPFKVTVDDAMDVRGFIEKLGGDINDIIKNHAKYPADLLSADTRQITGRDTRYSWNITLIGHPDREKKDFAMEHISSRHEATPLTIHINCSNRDIDGILELEWVYREDYFSGSDIKRIHRCLAGIIEDMLDNPARKISGLELPPGEKKGRRVWIGGEGIVLDEIENRLQSHDHIKEAAVVVSPGGEQRDNPLVAYVTSGEVLTEPQLRNYLSEELPPHMIPPLFVQLETMPLTPGGKIAREVLENLEIRVNKGTTYQAPADEVEIKLAGIWAEVLAAGIEVIGNDVNFFQLGGNSLSAAVMAAKIHKEFNVRLPLANVFERPTIKGLAQTIKGLAEDKFKTIEPVEEKEYYPLSSMQKGLYLQYQLDPENITYNIPQFFIIKGELDRVHLVEVFKKLIRRHEGLRTSFEVIDNQPVQKIHRLVPFALENCSPGEVETVIRDFVAPFDLSTMPLMRVGLINITGGHCFLMVDIHHIISDGRSNQILARDFLRLNGNTGLAPLRLRYRDFSEWKNRLFESGEIEKQEKYWLKMFAGKIPVLNLPTDFTRPAVQSFAGEWVNFDLTGEVTVQLKKLAEKKETTLYMVLLAILDVWLSKICGQEAVIIGTSAEGRGNADLHRIIGMFVNTLVLINFPRGEKTFSGFLKEVKESTLEALENQDYPYEELVRKAVVKRDPGRNPLFDVHFVFNTAVVEPGNLPEPGTPDLNLAAYREKNSTAKFDINLMAAETAGGLSFALEYCTKLFKKQTIEKFAAYFNDIVSFVLEDNDGLLEDIKISHSLSSSEDEFGSEDYYGFEF